ncbi:MAG: hypothetical protein ACI9XO_003765 [Paraglaciecola sp.]|jgi:hypothetical protein
MVFKISYKSIRLFTPIETVILKYLFLSPLKIYFKRSSSSPSYLTGILTCTLPNPALM